MPGKYFLLQSDGVYCFCQDVTANWNDGSNHVGEIGKKWWPDRGVWRYAKFRLPDHHRKRTATTFLDNLAMVVHGPKWDNELGTAPVTITIIRDLKQVIITILFEW